MRAFLSPPYMLNIPISGVSKRVLPSNRFLLHTRGKNWIRIYDTLVRVGIEKASAPEEERRRVKVDLLAMT